MFLIKICRNKPKSKGGGDRGGGGEKERITEGEGVGGACV